MSSSENSQAEEVPVVVLFEGDLESSVEPPCEEWSSLNFEIPEGNIKRLNYAEGLYDPGSGEICEKYIPMSASSVFRHPYYNYPGVLDPGVKEALLNPIPKITYADDGQEIYLALCKETEICPVRNFYRQLLENSIDLKYYGVNPRNIRAMAISLRLNRTVKELNLTDNWIDNDGCFHLGQMFVDNITLTELNLTGCRIGPQGARRLFCNLALNRSLKVLILTKNQLLDEGVQYLAKAIFRGADVANINLSYNNLTATCLESLSEAFETTNKLTHLNLSWNSILNPNAVYLLCQRLSVNLNLQELDLSWNSLSGLRVGNAIKTLMKNRNIRRIILNNNKLEGSAIKSIGRFLPKAIKLEVLDLSYNPMTPADALNLLRRFKEPKVKLRKLIMENVLVSFEFLEVLGEIRKLKFRENTVIIYGGVKAKFIPKLVDMREIAMNRAEAICKQVKKSPKDIALIVLALYKLDKAPLGQKEFAKAVRSNGANLDEDLVELLTNLFPGPRTEKTKTINLSLVVDYIKRKWPDRKLPPTPPEPPPEPVVTQKKGKK